MALFNTHREAIVGAPNNNTIGTWSTIADSTLSASGVVTNDGLYHSDVVTGTERIQHSQIVASTAHDYRRGLCRRLITQAAVQRAASRSPVRAFTTKTMPSLPTPVRKSGEIREVSWRALRSDTRLITLGLLIGLGLIYLADAVARLRLGRPDFRSDTLAVARSSPASWWAAMQQPFPITPWLFPPARCAVFAAEFRRLQTDPRLFSSTYRATRLTPP